MAYLLAFIGVLNYVSGGDLTLTVAILGASGFVYVLFRELQKRYG